MLGSLAPDVDILVAPFGWDRYLLSHEVGTHTIAMSPLLALATAAIITRFVSEARVRPLFWPAMLGAAIGHVLFDLVSGSDIRVFVPFWSGRVGLHWIAMVDALAIGPLIAGTLAALWRPRLAAAMTIAALTVVVTSKAWSQHLAAKTFATGRGVRAEHPEPVNGTGCRWRFFERDDDHVTVWHVDACTGEIRRAFTRPHATGDVVEASKKAPVVRALLAFAHVPFARMERLNNHVLVLWSDLQHCDEQTCHLSFGVELDASLGAIRQLVRIGPIEQWRRIE